MSEVQGQIRGTVKEQHPTLHSGAALIGMWLEHDQKVAGVARDLGRSPSGTLRAINTAKHELLLILLNGNGNGASS